MLLLIYIQHYLFCPLDENIYEGLCHIAFQYLQIVFVEFLILLAHIPVPQQELLYDSFFYKMNEFLNIFLCNYLIAIEYIDFHPIDFLI